MQDDRDEEDSKHKLDCYTIHRWICCVDSGIGCILNLEDVLVVIVKMSRQMARQPSLFRVELIMEPMMIVRPVRVGPRKDTIVGGFPQ